MKNLKSRSVNAVAWSTGSQLLKTVLTFFIVAVLARPLWPSEFGLLGMVVVIANFAKVFMDSGFNNAIIQKDELTDIHYCSVFWFNFFVGSALTILMFFAAPLIAGFYNKPELRPIAQVISLCFVVWSLQLVQNAVLIKAFQFRRIAIIELTAVVISGIVAISMAYSNCGVWSLVAQLLALATTSTSLLWFFSNWRPKLRFSFSAIRDLLNFSSFLLATNVINYWVRNLDNLLIGKYLGEVPLGFYGRAYNVMMMPITNLSASVSRVLFPSLSRIQNDPDKVRSVFLRVTRVIGFVSYPATLGLLVVAPHFIEIALGEKWIPMSNVLRILCLVSLIQSTSSLIGNLYLSQGRTDLQFKVMFLLRVNSILGIIFGLSWGIEGVAAGYLIAVILNQIPNLYFSGKLVGLTIPNYFKSVWPSLACALAMAIFVFGVVLFCEGRFSIWLSLLVEITTGICFYGVLVRILRLRSLYDAIDAVSEITPRLRLNFGRPVT